MSEPWAVVHNYRAGTRRRNVEEIVELLAEGGVAVQMFEAGRHKMAATAREVAAGPYRVIVAAGGDGTISTVAGQLVGTDRRLGVVPIGTLNHFAKDAGIPLGIRGAVHNLLQGHTAQFDVGEVNGRYFLNNASLGIYPRVVSLREQHRSRWGKWIAFVQAVVTALRTYRLLHARVEIEGEQLDRRTPFVFVGNNVYHYEGRHLGRRTDLTSGKLCLLMAPAAHRMRLVWLALLAIFGRLHGVRDFDEYVAPELRIEVRRERLCIALDGELAFVQTPLHFRIRPKALQVIVPAAAPQRVDPRE